MGNNVMIAIGSMETDVATCARLRLAGVALKVIVKNLSTVSVGTELFKGEKSVMMGFHSKAETAARFSVEFNKDGCVESRTSRL